MLMFYLWGFMIKKFIYFLGCIGFVISLVKTDLSVADDASLIEILQVAETVNQGGSVEILSSATSQTSLALGNGVDNTISITQNAGLSAANVAINAGEESAVTGGSGNNVTIVQNNEANVLNFSIDGNSNNINIGQNSDGAAIKMNLAGDGLVININ